MNIMTTQRKENMNKTELINAVAESTELTKKDSASALDAVLTTISSTLASGESVQILGFGTFSVKTRAARTGRNPATGESMEFPESKNVAFKAGSKLKETVQ